MLFNLVLANISISNVSLFSHFLLDSKLTKSLSVIKKKVMSHVITLTVANISGINYKTAAFPLASDKNTKLIT